MVTPPPEADPEPFLRVTRGHPTDEELAAVVAVLLDHEPCPDSQAPKRHRSLWADPATVLRLARLPRLPRR